MPPAELNGRAVNGVKDAGTTIICFSHLRWNFVYQRPQHLLSRAAAHARVFVMEEPETVDVAVPTLRTELQAGGVQVLVPQLPLNHDRSRVANYQRALLDDWMEEQKIGDFIAWYYTPMALLFSGHLRPEVTVYDCMDQLSAFQGAPPELIEQEQQLYARADVVFTGGRSLYEAKRGEHNNVHLFASSVDHRHFAASRIAQADPEDQFAIPHPRIGFFGVLDERLDCELLRKVAACEPTWQLVLIGPVVKIRDEDLPRAANIHYLGQKQYRELPKYLAHWDVAMLPFAQNASTRFISPTKTPEYLAAGKPVVSTPVRDVVEPYGRLGLARIAATAEEFCAAIRKSLQPPDKHWLPMVDEFLGHTSWDATFGGMWSKVMEARSTGLEAVCKSEEVVDV